MGSIETVTRHITVSCEYCVFLYWPVRRQKRYGHSVEPGGSWRDSFIVELYTSPGEETLGHGVCRVISLDAGRLAFEVSM
jgi:hypothetical protein